MDKHTLALYGVLWKSFHWSIMVAITTLFLSSLCPHLLDQSLSSPLKTDHIHTFHFYSFTLFVTVYSSLCCHSTSPSIFLYVFLDFCSTKGSSPPHPRHLPGDGGQQEAGGQCSKSMRQQWQLCELHGIQRHGALLCCAAPSTPSILQWLSLLTQPNCYHGQRTVA